MIRQNPPRKTSPWFVAFVMVVLRLAFPAGAVAGCIFGGAAW